MQPETPTKETEELNDVTRAKCEKIYRKLTKKMAKEFDELDSDDVEPIYDKYFNLLIDNIKADKFSAVELADVICYNIREGDVDSNIDNATMFLHKLVRYLTTK